MDDGFLTSLLAEQVYSLISLSIDEKDRFDGNFFYVNFDIFKICDKIIGAGRTAPETVSVVVHACETPTNALRVLNLPTTSAVDQENELRNQTNSHASKEYLQRRDKFHTSGSIVRRKKNLALCHKFVFNKM